MAEACDQEEVNDEEVVGDEELKEIKKIRKKLRQIQKLERLNRNLNDEEESKLNKKYELRGLLSQLMDELKYKGINESFNKSGNTPDDSSHVSSLANNSSLLQETELKLNVGDDTNSSTIDEPVASKNDIPTPALGECVDRDVTVSNSNSAGQGECVDRDVTVSNSNSADHPITSTPARTECSNNNNSDDWLDYSAVITPLEGHNDVVCTVDANGDTLMTGSRDTTVKVWSLHSFTELRSMGFHSAAVTCVKIIPDDDELLSGMTDEERNNCCFGISSSLDCHIVLWNLETGRLVHKVYTYSSIQCFVYHKAHVYVGSDGGKIDMWRITDRCNVRTLSRSGCGITCMTLSGAWLFCGRTRGTIQVWDIESGDRCFDWESSCGTTTGGNDDGGEVSTVTSSRCVRCICYHGDKIYWGDDGTNLKMLKWTEGSGSGKMKKLTNHVHQFGSSGGVAVCDRRRVLFSAGYDLDTGHSLINVRRLSDDNEYICTIQDDRTLYISCMCVVNERSDKEGDRERGAKDCVRLVTGGDELHVIDIHKFKNPKLDRSQRVTACHFNDKLTSSYSTDDDSDESLLSEPVDDSRTVLHEKPLPRPRRNTGPITQDQQSWVWWMFEKCTIL